MPYRRNVAATGGRIGMSLPPPTTIVLRTGARLRRPAEHGPGYTRRGHNTRGRGIHGPRRRECVGSGVPRSGNRQRAACHTTRQGPRRRARGGVPGGNGTGSSSATDGRHAGHAACRSAGPAQPGGRATPRGGACARDAAGRGLRETVVHKKMRGGIRSRGTMELTGNLFPCVSTWKGSGIDYPRKIARYV